MRITRDAAKKLGLDFASLWLAATPSVPRSAPIAIPGEPALVFAAGGEDWWVIEIAHWRPASLNELMQSKHDKIQLKKRDRKVIGMAAMDANVPPATGKRRVSLTITLPKGQRRFDKDAFWKSTLDALTHTVALIDDRPDYCEPGTVDYERGAELRTKILLEDIA